MSIRTRKSTVDSKVDCWFACIWEHWWTATSIESIFFCNPAGSTAAGSTAVSENIRTCLIVLVCTTWKTNRKIMFEKPPNQKRHETSILHSFYHVGVWVCSIWLLMRVTSTLLSSMVALTRHYIFSSLLSMLACRRIQKCYTQNHILQITCFFLVCLYKQWGELPSNYLLPHISYF